ncbi:MAG: RluA family pseudouridine synthase [Lentisphaerae bacterium]|nr:RluA family pseudouridine synthase [Lentisphaerota bacterium]
MNVKTHNFTITPDTAGRLDRAVALLIPDCSRTFLQNLIKNGAVSVAGTTVIQPRFAVKSGDKITVSIPDMQLDEHISAEPFAFDILFEDQYFLVIDKPAGVVVHPAPGNREGTIVNALMSRYPGMAEDFALEDSMRPGIVHRLDKDTSGCLAVAKTVEAKFKLGAAFADRKTGKTYLAICRGVPKQLAGELKTLIGRHPVNRQKMAIVERNGKEAHTAYRILAQKVVDNIPLALVEVKIFTGRTHQIRVHLSSIGLPIIGDELYGNRNCTFPGVTRQMLHARKLTLPHPASGEIMSFTSPLPEDFRRMSTLCGIEF